MSRLAVMPFVLVALAVLGLASAPTLAAERPVGAETLHEKALAAMEDKRYAEAAELFHAAFALDPAPELLWNEARARHLAGELERARELYKAFIERDDAPSSLRGRANDAIVEITRALDKPDEPDPIEPMDDTLGIALVVGGGVVLAGGAIVHALSFGAADDMETYSVPSQGLSDEERLRRYNDAKSDRDTFQTLAIVGYAVGGAALVGGIVSLVLTDDPEPTTSFVPSPWAVPGGGGALATWRF